MSIASEITRLQGAKADIKTTIQNKGVTVPSNALLDDFDTYIAQISGGGVTGLVYETGTYTPSADIARPEISFTNQHTTSPIFVGMFENEGTYDSTLSTCINWIYVDSYKLFGKAYIPTTDISYYGFVYYNYRSNSASSITTGSTQFQHSSNETGTTKSYAKYWVTDTLFRPYCDSATRYWRNGKTYKWIAIWK